MLSANREDYIKKVFETNEINTKLTNKDLARSLGVSAASSSEMIKKLIMSGHVAKDKKLGLVLSEKGREEALKLIRNHRLWEVFLVDKLGYSWADVHDEAEVLEHVTSMVLGDRLNEFLNHPMFCPHGSIIYGNDGEDRGLINMDQLEVGSRAIIRQIDDLGGVFKYLEEKQIKMNTEFEVIEISDFVLIKVLGEEVSLSMSSVSSIFVEVVV